jgi:hyperosmotically inducible periplasmic protein
MTNFHLAATLAGLLSTVVATGAARAGDESSKKAAPRHAADKDTPAADNTATNQRDRKDSEPTADQQKNGKSDLDLTAEIRRSVMADKDLSMNAHNVKIIAQNGKVTLKGPVNSAHEKKVVEDKARQIAGTENTVSELQIKH